ncbi:sigma-54-dependent Fis family transcriptional regulator [Alicyclobacillus herbarius]|uniref:sigma-54-dependent Fis family transcriptional regulator n=1 Tax=Alicyclobacillus herbarius TaxID=122960 RepID=UPI0003FA1E73|nr:sigma-54-dependent Fis family transcriptional regulator [Alicyclobacillus herbarius]
MPGEKWHLSNRVWKRFVEEGVLDAYRVSYQIAESWLRCRQIGVNPYAGRGREILTGPEFSARKRQSARLQAVAEPHLRRLYQNLRGAGFIVLLIDADGYVLSMMGDEDIVRRARDIQFVEGVRWTEAEVGTNAIGTSLVVNQPLMLIGSEHYAVASQDWSCAAAPIHDTDGAVVGVVDVSGLPDAAKLDTLAEVTLTAYAIEQAWRSEEQAILTELLHVAHHVVAQKQVRCTILTDGQQRIVHVSRDLERIGRHGFRRPLQEFLNEGFRVQHIQPIASPTRSDREVPIGYLVSVLAIPKDKSVLAPGLGAAFRFTGEPGMSAAFQSLLSEVRQLAGTDTSVLICGESGTGKELVARAIHENSPRRHGPFVALNCGAVPDNLLESELFGYIEGAFTGARKGGHKGKLVQADGGTLFLDEVEAMSRSLQVALLRVLQEREVVPVGSSRVQHVDFRLISASNQDLWELVQRGEFRADLYYRLCVYPLTVPPLRERREDIPSLIQFYARRHGWRAVLAQEVLERLTAYDWPGNVRELFNVLEQLRVKAPDGVVGLAHLPAFLSPPSQMQGEDIDLDNQARLSYREQIQRQAMMRALTMTGGNVTQAAQRLNVPRSTFYRRMRKFGL